ncbi:MAG: class I SAM-dependent methyltransferase [Ilumatobacteraceae bacterium]
MTDITAAHFVAGMLGGSLLRHWYEDGEANERRMAELVGVLERLDEPPLSWRLNPVERDLEQGYAEWAPDYDGPNPLIATERPIVQAVLTRLAGEGVRALDAACGTGRHAEYLADLGCDTVGVDRSEAMLAAARTKSTSVEYELGDIEALPYEDATFDLVVISLALCHLADPTAAVVELGRVLRPGGTLVISDLHPTNAIVGGQAFYATATPERPMPWVRNHYHLTSTWLPAFERGGLDVEECREVPPSEEQIEAVPIYGFFPEATRTAMEGLPVLWVWQLTRRGRSDR